MIARIVLFLVACCGWAVLFFGGWIAWRGVALYAGDPVLMGTGGGLAVGGLLVVALTIGAGAQIATARDTARMARMMEAAGRARTALGASTTTPGAPASPAPVGRSEPVLRRGATPERDLPPTPD